MKIFAKIPNSIFSRQIKDSEGNIAYTNENSYFDLIQDDKIIKVIYNIIIGTNFLGVCNTSINELILLCDYKQTDKNIKSFKELIAKMHEKNIIKIKNKFDKANDLIKIDTSIIFNDCNNGYTVLEPKELSIIDNISSNSRERNTLLKCYLFIKMMVYKRNDNTLKGLYYNCESQTVSMDYNYICKFTKIADITKCINKLQEAKLIMFDNFLVYKSNNIEYKRDSKDIYGAYQLEAAWNEDLVKEDLRIGLNQLKNVYKQKGY